ncbi:MAG TPA: TolC family protein [Vicinamibacterales bacterium]|nr:TolC family protein [Vicinamibacterales bacterium]
MSAFGQTAPAAPAPQSAQPAPAQGTPLTIEEAVRMALENNLGIQTEKLNPQIQVLGIARANAAFTPTLFSSASRRSSTAPPTDFNTSGVGQAISTSANFSSQGGVQQNLKWLGSNYSVSFDGSKATTNAINSVFNPQLGSGLNAVFNQPLLRNFKIDGLRQQLWTSQNNATIADIQLQQRITQTSRNVRAAYYQLVGALAGLDVAQQSLEVARTSLKNNQTRVEVGTMAPIDIVTAEAEVASNEEAVILAQAQIEAAQDNLRALVMNPNQPGFWGTRFAPAEQPNLAPRQIDLDAAVKNALQNRSDLREFRKQMENTDIGMRFAANQKLPAIDLQARYGLAGVAGTRYSRDEFGNLVDPTIRSFTDAVRDVFANDFKTWSVAVNVSYPLGTSTADAAHAQARLQKQQEQVTLANLELAVTQSVRDAARQVTTGLRRVEATRRARELAQQRLDADNKRFAVGLATTFELLQSQRDLARARQAELRATIDYNQSLVDFEAVQIAPIR